MLDNRKLLFTVVSLALVGVLALFAYSTTIRPLDVELGQIDTGYVGKVVTTNGTISSARILSDGSLSMKLFDIDTLANISVYVQSDVYKSWTGNLTPGSLVEVTGEVSQYQEEMEISVAGIQDMRVVSQAGDIAYDLWTVMDSVEMFDGMTIKTNGSMLDIEVIRSNGQLVGTSLSLYRQHDNQSYSLECMVFDEDLAANFEDWDSITVTGEISYYSNGGTWQLIVDSIEK